MSDQKGYSFSIYDANPAFDIKLEYSDIIFAYSDEQALEMAQSNLEDAAFGLGRDLGCSVGDIIYLTLSDSNGTLLATFSYNLTAEDLGIIEEIDPAQFIIDGSSAIGSYSELCGGPDGNEPDHFYVYITASKSNRYYSFVAKDSNEKRLEYGSVYYSRDEAIKAAQQFIQENDKTSRLEDVIGNIESFNWFNSNADIAHVVKQMCQYPGGDLLVDQDGNANWVSSNANAWLHRCAYVRVRAHFDSPEQAAINLFKNIAAIQRSC